MLTYLELFGKWLHPKSRMNLSATICNLKFTEPTTWRSRSYLHNRCVDDANGASSWFKIYSSTHVTARWRSDSSNIETVIYRTLRLHLLEPRLQSQTSAKTLLEPTLEQEQITRCEYMDWCRCVGAHDSESTNGCRVWSVYVSAKEFGIGKSLQMILHAA